MSSNNSQAGSMVILLVSVLVSLVVIYLAVFSADEAGPMMDSADVQQRIRPVVTLDDLSRKAAAPAPAAATVEPAPPAVVETAVAEKSAADLYAASCQVCHSTGAAGAPKLGVAADWSARVGNGYDALVQSALNGKGAMPPRGGSALSDAEIGSIVQYMLDQAQ